MLLALIHWLADSTSLGWLRVFNYLTLRAVLAALDCLLYAPWPWARRSFVN